MNDPDRYVPELAYGDARELKGWGLRDRRPAPRAGVRLVFLDAKGRAWAPAQPLTLGEAVWGKLKTMYEVDLREHPSSVQDRLQCSELGFFFDVRIGLSWKITDPARIVTEGHEDVRPLYTGFLSAVVREFSERFGLEDRLAAEKALGARLATDQRLPQGLVLSGCAVRLSLGEEAAQYLGSRQRAVVGRQERTLKNEADVHAAELEKELLEARKEVDDLRGRQRLDHKLRGLEAQQQIEALQFELDRERAERELEIKGMRIRYFSTLLENGNHAAIFLEANPGEVGELINLFLSQRREELDNTRRMLASMLQSGLLNGQDIDEPRRVALNRVLEGLNTTTHEAIFTPRPAGSLDAPQPDAGERKARAARDDDDDEDDE